MDTPTNRKEFERHINMLFEGIEQRKHHFSNSLRIINSLLDAKKLPNKRTDFISINETVRLLANSRATFTSSRFKEYFNAEQ